MNPPDPHAARAIVSPAAAATAAAMEDAHRLSGHVVVGGKLAAARSAETFEVENPAEDVVDHRPLGRLFFLFSEAFFGQPVIFT